MHTARAAGDGMRDSGIKAEEAYLKELGATHAAKWQQYLDRLKELGIPYPTLGVKS